ncbi:MAG: methionine--tRNA ligase [Alphaproteobacteria bacterium]|nr:methionine--tRNA ligase [Alphaproteobacteria bacterium]MDA8004925.1 methionine--tRNA ligase [Alphaproteobacteria bacterium]MDA8013963.1 methionine--tRNA ligase [Alphaproteobacteria bacterium]
MQKKFFITTPIYYVNDTPHIGHAYTSLACDVLARYKRLQGHEVHFLTGTDEHGEKVQKAADAAGQSPQTFTDQISENFRELAHLMNYSVNDFIRTTEDRHKDTVAEVWRRLRANDQIYLGKYAGWYAVRDEAYYAESETTLGEDGKRRAASGAEVQWIEEPSYFFRLSQWQDKLLRFYGDNPDFLAPEHRRNEIMSFVSGGLHDLSVSRTSFSWGIRVPDDPAHVVYVWLDALVNYLSATGWPEEQNLWPADIHMVGKDILRFHSVYWPAFLMAADIEVPRRVFGHGWLLNRGRKMSKSEGNVLKPAELVERYGLDPLRYYLLREVPFGQDGYIGHETLVRRCNAELSNGVGNLAQRSLKMVSRDFGGEAPVLDAGGRGEAVYQAGLALSGRVTAHIDAQRYHLALDEVWSYIGAVNRYFDDRAPWEMSRRGDPALGGVLAVTLEAVRAAAVLLHSFMPASMDALLAQLGADVSGGIAGLTEPMLARGLPEPSPIFSRLEE